MNLDQMTPAAAALARRRGHRQDNRAPRTRPRLVVGGADLSDVLQRFTLCRGHARITGTLYLEGAVPDELPMYQAVELWDGARTRHLEVVGSEVRRAHGEYARVELNVEGWA